MTSASGFPEAVCYREGYESGYRGVSKDENPYIKGWSRICGSTEVETFVEAAWEDGWRAGSKKANRPACDKGTT